MNALWYLRIVIFLIDVPLYRATVFRYLFTRLTDKSRMQACMDRLLAYQRRLGHEGEAVDVMLPWVKRN